MDRMKSNSIMITPLELHNALSDAFRDQASDKFKEPLINYLGWHLFGVTFPSVKSDPAEEASGQAMKEQGLLE